MRIVSLPLCLLIALSTGLRAADKETAQKHWAFQPISRPKTPDVADRKWVQNPIDAFVLARLEKAGLKPAAPADRATLLRRAHFDLLGLPPDPKAIEDFLADNGPSWDTTIKNLLASPHYGERWGRYWLDVVRYADSAGYEIDDPYDHAWLYRDYVIRSFNADKPFDRFVQEQIAGDHLWPDSEEARLATGFATVGPYAYEGGIIRSNVVEYQRLTDLADTTTSAFLGLTAGCARCHDHKFDPISQEDYFGLQAIFAASKPIKTPVQPNKDVKATMLALTHTDKAPKTQLLHRGEIGRPQNEVSPAIFRTFPDGGPLAEKNADDFKKRRTMLAEWLTSPKNPLTARVIVNRVWQWHFGYGLVRTPNDFGTQGEPPTHPELLDWLADELVSNKWSLKHLHRLILQSATYQMASKTDKATAAKDPEHRLLSRFPRRRLEAEAIWDNLHATSGSINLTLFGPAVYPPIPAEAIALKLNVKWNSQNYKSQWTRRAVYMVVRRSLVHPFFEAFNVTLPVASSGTRDATVVPPQALELLNGPIAVEQAQRFTGRLLSAKDTDEASIVSQAWLLAFGRPITKDEKERALAFLAEREQAHKKAEREKKKIPEALGAPAKTDVARAAAVVELCLALLNANEFIYID